LRVFENMVLRRIFGTKMDEVTGEWRVLHNEEVNYLYSSSSIVRVRKNKKTEKGGTCSTLERYNAFWVGRLEGKIPLGRHRRK